MFMTILRDLMKAGWHILTMSRHNEPEKYPLLSYRKTRIAPTIDDLRSYVKHQLDKTEKYCDCEVDTADPMVAAIARARAMK